MVASVIGQIQLTELGGTAPWVRSCIVGASGGRGSVSLKHAAAASTCNANDTTANDPLHGREHTREMAGGLPKSKATYARRPATVRRPRTRTWEDRPDVETTRRSSLVARSLSSRVDESSAVSRLLLSRLSRVTDGRCVRVRASAS